MAKAETVEALLSPSLRVSRPVAACSRCRSAKIKCDGKLPACTACERTGKKASCSGANDEFARGKERSYVAALEAASERLQRRIDEAKGMASLSNAAFAGSALFGNALGHPGIRRTASGGQRQEASDVDELVGDLGFLSVNATSRDFHGFTSNMSFARLLLSASTAAELPPSAASPLPPRHVIAPFIQHYLDNVFVLMPFFSETELMTSISDLYGESGVPAKPMDHWYVRMILAISAGATSQHHGDSNHQMALQHVSAAFQYVDRVLRPGSMAGIKALLLLVQYSMVDPEHFNSSYLIGMASRIMVDLGLHVEPSAGTRISKSELDMRRRVFYCVYAIDRNISISCARPFSFTDDSASDVLLPAIGNSLNAGGPGNQAALQLFTRSLQPSLFLFDIRRVQSAFYQATRYNTRATFPQNTAAEYTSSILKDIQAWNLSVPQSLSQRHVLFFRLEAVYSQILALSPSTRIPSTSMTDQNKMLLFEYVLEYINQMQPVVQDTSWHAFLTYTDICRVKFVGRQFLDIMWTSFDTLLTRSRRNVPDSPPASSFSTSSLARDNCARSLTCLRKILETLDFARQRWGLTNLRDEFKQESAVLMGKLMNKQQELGSSQYRSSMPTLQEPIGQSSMNAFIDLQSVQMQNTHGTQNPQAVMRLSVGNDDMQDDDMQRPQFLRATSSGPVLPEAGPLPQSSRPRRSYEFMGGLRS